MVTEVQWSELQRDPKQVARLADEGTVRVRRRDGVPLLLIREDQAESSASGAVTAGRALRNAIVHLPHEDVARVLIDEFPWVDVLPLEDQKEFVRDFARAFLASAELKQWSVLEEVLHSWRNTAAAYADPRVRRRLLEPSEGDGEMVPPPVGD